LIEITDLFLKNKQTWNYLDEWFDIASEFIANTEGNSSLTHMIMDNLEKIDQQKITISTVLKLYFNLIVYGTHVLIS
jgi:hypothetical protein